MQKLPRSDSDPKGKPSLLDELRNQKDDNGQEFWKPKEGDGIEGVITQITRGNKYKSLHIHLQDDPRIVSAYPDSMLEKKILELQPQVGDYIAILFSGEAVSEAGRTYKKYRVAVKPAEKAKPAGIFGAKG